MIKRTQIYLEASQHKNLKHIAVEKNISLAELIRRIVNEYLERETQNVSQYQNKLALERSEASSS